MTTKFKKWLPVHVFIPYFDNLPRNSMACLEQIRTIDKSRLQEYCGNVGDEIMDKVDQAISVSLGTKNSQVYKQDAVEDETRRGIGLGMIKRDTIFDGKVNDWLQFAEQQLVFFSEIEQYMVNLELTRNSLDEETDSILEYISSTNYNVTQGYKIYRMLRERRKQRSAIIDELEKLEFLTEKMDCEQMRQLYQEAIASMQKLSLETMRDNMMQQLLEEEVG